MTSKQTAADHVKSGYDEVDDLYKRGEIVLAVRRASRLIRESGFPNDWDLDCWSLLRRITIASGYDDLHQLFRRNLPLDGHVGDEDASSQASSGEKDETYQVIREGERVEDPRHALKREREDEKRKPEQNSDLHDEFSFIMHEDSQISMSDLGHESGDSNYYWSEEERIKERKREEREEEREANAPKVTPVQRRVRALIDNAFKRKTTGAKKSVGSLIQKFNRKDRESR